jgi:hypothetical protein
MSSHCRHQWEDRTEVLRAVFAASPEHAEHFFAVCARCMKIRETPSDELRQQDQQRPLYRLLKVA